jgi:poly-gamma-glutamate synthesis protein (capsule biosynthesis protein)
MKARVAIATILLLGGLAASWFCFTPQHFKASARNGQEIKPIPPEFTDKSLFLTPIMYATGTIPDGTVSGITVPHHLLAADLIANTFLLASRGSYDTVVVMSPDHFDLGSTDISLASRDFITVFGNLTTDQDLVRKLSASPFVSTADFFYREHGIQAELPFVKYYFPNAKIVAITFKESTPRQEISDFTDQLEKSIGSRTLIVQSTDFSHYLTAEAAHQKDLATMRIIRDDDPGEVFSLNQSDNLDSAAAQYVQMKIQKDVFKAAPVIMADKNSQDYTTEKMAQTTSYITQLYVANSFGINRNPLLVAVGDVMLGRHVETLIDLYGSGYPFEKISSTLEGADAVIGNLEGVINKDHVHTANYDYGLSFPPDSAAVLAANHFSILALGNNHAYDFGPAGFADTVQALKDQSLISVGNPDSAGEKFSHTDTIAGKEFSFASFNATDPTFSTSSAIGLIQDLRWKHPNALMVTLIHWGTEYQLLQSIGQRSLAHELIDAGADLILGSHPHVVEGIEIYRNRPIFYSLGNFIFDQYFSTGTQQELMVKIGVNDSAFTAELIPLQSIQSQPMPMAPNEASAWLKDLAVRSDPLVAQQIGSGTLVVNF